MNNAIKMTERVHEPIQKRTQGLFWWIVEYYENDAWKRNLFFDVVQAYQFYLNKRRMVQNNQIASICR